MSSGQDGRPGMKRVVVTGLGVVTSLGLEVQENWDKAIAGVSGIQKLSFPNTASSPVQAVGQVQSWHWRTILDRFPEEARNEKERRTLFALYASRSALDDARLTTSGSLNDRFGVMLAAGLGINCLEDLQTFLNPDGSFDSIRFGKELRDVRQESIMRNNSNRHSALIAKTFGFGGINSTITTACASATQALGTAYRAIQRGDADVILAGGSDSMINPIGLVFFVLLNAAAVSDDNPSSLCRPFDRKRSGLVMGEGAGIAVLEEEGHALRRGARVYAEVKGYGSSIDAYKVTAPDPKGNGAKCSMRSALSDARMEANEIDYINAHGTSTRLNDSAETMAIKDIFGTSAYALSISSSKSLIGHLLAASGGPEFVFTTLSVSRDEIHPTINLLTPDPKCDLDYVPLKKRSRTVRAALSNSFGFGGQNSSIVLKKYIQ